MVKLSSPLPNFMIDALVLFNSAVTIIRIRIEYAKGGFNMIINRRFDSRRGTNGSLCDYRGHYWHRS